jgi:phage shock protein C
MNIADEIKRLHELHQSGALTDAEFAQAKAKLLGAADSGNSMFNSETGDSQSMFGSQKTESNSNSTQSGPNDFDQTLTQLNRFRRSKTDQWLGGICGGLGKFTGLESWVWRLLFVLFTFYFGFGLVAYLLAWIFVPEED